LHSLIYEDERAVKDVVKIVVEQSTEMSP